MDAARTVILVIFWVSVTAVLYAYAIYPVVLTILARLFGDRPEAVSIAEGDLPDVALLIAAHNEEEVIEGRLQNALALDYPREKLQVVIASDGSRDRTAEIVQRQADGRSVCLL